MPNSDSSGSKRIFIGVPVPKEISRRIQMLKTLVTAPVDSIRWVSGHNLHITLLFLGNISEVVIEMISSRLKGIETELKFILSIEDTGVFPNADKPRIFWMDINQGRDSLLKLQTSVSEAVSEFNVVRDEFAYIPHLTIGRVGRHTKLWKIDTGEYLNAVYEPIVFEIEKFYLYMSELFPEGPKYTVIDEYILSSAGA